MARNTVSFYRLPGKLLPARGTLFLSRPEAIGTYALISIVLNFLLFLLPFGALGLGISSCGDILGIYTHQSSFSLWDCRSFQLYWKSHFGEKEIVEITEGANWNARKLFNHLKEVSLPHYQLFRVLEARSSPPTDRERDLARGAIELTPDILEDLMSRSRLRQPR
ncbi:hypothetical protein C8R45DRAFT_946367 [Mycena sanguinolenta]|nr:hypothetical protein C8R45DRAFT_946367 [Mycena sanguinolenta]